MNALEFYEKNKNLEWRFPSLPLHIKTNYDTADFILNKLDFGWLELDLDIDLNKWQEESKFATFVDHRGTDHPGWNSCCIHGINVNATGSWANYGYKSENEVPYQWTSLSENTPNIKNFWSEFPYDSYRRIRFMEVRPNGIINPHSDMPGRLPGEESFDSLKFGVPINVAIIHPENCFMTLEGFGVVPWKEGKAFIINIRHFHSVINFSNRSRIHLIAHGRLNQKTEEFVELITRSYHKQYERH